MIFFLILIGLLSLFILFVLPILLFTALLPLPVAFIITFLWAMIYFFWFCNAENILIQSYHAKPLSSGKRINSYIKLEHFFDRRINYPSPPIYLQTFSEMNPLIILTKGNQFVYIFSESYYRQLNEEDFFNLLTLIQKHHMILPFKIGAKLLSIKVLFLHFFKNFNLQVNNIPLHSLKIPIIFLGFISKYISLPVFLFSGWVYTKVWFAYLEETFSQNGKSTAVWNNLKDILQDKNHMILLGYLTGSGYGEVKAYPLIAN